MAKTLGMGGVGEFQQKTQQEILKASEQAAQSLLTGAEDYQRRLQEAAPAAERALYGQAAAGLAAGAAQAGRGGASAYGGALQGGLQAAQQAAGFGFTNAQALADAAKMQSEGFATQATAKELALKYGNVETQRQALRANIMAEVTKIGNQTIGKGFMSTDDIAGMKSRFDQLLQVYKDNPYARAVIRRQRDLMIQTYSGFDKDPTMFGDFPALSVYLAEEGVTDG